MATNQGQGTSLKEQMIQVISALPDDASVEDAIDRLHLLYKVQVGMEQAARGLVLSDEEMQKQFDEWLQ